MAFQRAHPGVRVSIVPGNSAQTMDALRSHRAELGVVGGFAAAPEIEAEPLVEEEIVVVGAPELAGRWMSRRDAEAATWISPVRGLGHPSRRRGGLGRHRYHPEPPPRATELGIGEAGGGSGQWRCRLQPVHRGRRAPGRLPRRRSAARLEGAADDLDRPASRGRAYAVGARVRGDAACAMAPPVTAATPRARNISPWSSLTPQSARNEIAHLNSASSIASRWGHHRKFTRVLRFLAIFESDVRHPENRGITPNRALEWQRNGNG